MEKKKILVYFPAELVKRATTAALKQGISRNRFLQTAVEYRLRRVERELRNKELKEGYKANAERYEKDAREFEPIVAEALKGNSS